MCEWSAEYTKAYYKKQEESKMQGQLNTYLNNVYGKPHCLAGNTKIICPCVFSGDCVCGKTEVCGEGNCKYKKSRCNLCHK
jgi:hypothetical protein